MIAKVAWVTNFTAELSLRAVTHNTCYGWAHLMLQEMKVESEFRWHYKFLWDVKGEFCDSPVQGNRWWYYLWYHTQAFHANM